MTATGSGGEDPQWCGAPEEGVTRGPSRGASRRSGLRLAARLSRREVRRRPWRTLLVALLVAGPVAGMTVAVVFVRTSQVSPLEQWRLDYGRADASVRSGEVTGGAAAAVASLPPGSRVVRYRSDYRLIRTAEGRRAAGEISNLPVADPLVAETIRITGRAPARPSEVLLSATTARKLGATLGGTVDLDRPVDATLTVVGFGADRSSDDDLVLLHPDLAFPVRPGPVGGEAQLVDLPDQLTPEQTQAWADQSPGAVLAPGLVRSDRSLVPDPNRSAPIRWSWFAGALVLTVMGIVIASAFATGARRQLTTLGHLSANGAPPATLRRVLMLQGTWTGLVGSVGGLGLGAAALAALASSRSRLIGREIDSYDVVWADLGPIALLGIAAATVAAAIPARSASRVPVLAALAGHRPLAPVPRWLTATGAAVSAAGLGLLALATLGATGGGGQGSDVWTLTGIFGGVALLLGVCAVAPGYVSVLGPAAARLGGPWRLAARSLVRQRSRTGPVVSAVCVSAALAVALSSVVQSVEAADRRSEPARNLVVVSTRAYDVPPHPGPDPGAGLDPGTDPGPDLAPPLEVVLAPPSAIVDQLRRIVPEAQVAQQSWVGLGGKSRTSAVVADPVLLETYGFGTKVEQALQRVGLVLLKPVKGETLIPVEAPGRPPTTVRALAVEPDVEGGYLASPLLITPRLAADLGLKPEPGDVVLRQDGDLTADQRTALEAVYEEELDEQSRGPSASGVPAPFTNINFYRPYGAPDPLVVDAVLGGIALLFTLFVVATSLALAAAESRDERDVLTVVGASPRTVRRTSGVKAVVVTVFGAVLALPVGLLPVAVFTRVNPGDPAFVFPWRVAALLVVGVPLVAGLATTTASALALKLRPVRVSTMTFD